MKKIKEIKEDEETSLFEEIKFKSQAAMEYLMTYGWAILIIALALGVLYSLGILNPSALTPQVCSLSAPFFCFNQYLGSSGDLTFTLAQGSGSTIIINKIACVDNSLLGNNGLPKDQKYWSNGWLTSIPSGSSATFKVKCYASNGNSYTGKIGSTFFGTLLINASYSGSTTSFISAGSIGASVKTITLFSEFYPLYIGWSDNRTYLCTGQGMMGGYNNFGVNAATQKTIDLPAGKYNISFIFVKGDSWDGEYGRLYINGNLVWQKQYTMTMGVQRCGSGNTNWNELFDPISVVYSHSGGSLTLKFNSTLDQGANDEWWGVDRIIIAQAS